MAVFDAHQLTPGESDAIKSCTLFLTRSRIIVAFVGGINSRVFLTVIIALAASLIGLIFKNFLLFLIGFGAGITAGFFIVLSDFVMRRRKLGKIKTLNPEDVLQMNGNNFEILYSEIVKVETSTFDVYSRASLFVPLSVQEHKHEINLITKEKKHTFIVDEGVMQECLNLLRQFAPEIEETREGEVVQ